MPRLDHLAVKGNCFSDFYNHRLALPVFNGFVRYMLFLDLVLFAQYYFLELSVSLLLAVFVLFHCCLVLHFFETLNLFILLLMNIWVDLGYDEYTSVHILKHVLSSTYVHFFWVYS